MNQPLVIGYGNPQRQDDGLGWHIAHALEALVASQSMAPLSVVTSQQLQPEFSLAIARSSAVLFVDASCQANTACLHGASARPPLEIRPIGAQPSADRTAQPSAGLGPQPLSHQLTPQTLLGLTLLLEGRQPPGWSLVIPGRWFGFGEQLSPLAEQAKPEALALIRQWAQLPLTNA
jgi:Ni,Fe-hydrogenase maturation factor